MPSLRLVIAFQKFRPKGKTTTKSYKYIVLAHIINLLQE